MSEEIKFYSTKDAYGCFSNFAAYQIKLDGKTWPTTEHYFQAQKFYDSDYQEKIRQEKSPTIAARLGRSRKVKIRSDWESVKESIMRKALVAKFTQHPELTKILLNTNDAILIEHTTNDSYWGDGGDGTGKNRLGHLLMSVREELRQK
ncbi:MAG: NADAR family protein [Blastocatellia bacterium]|nr:NADAR family protein [Blastocatellia bacterium]MBL8194355.1 NADAR family protein [Blastocatellia bacterium]MBN8725527.1 NADAR family protein [Acidobacteriota bacterium]